MRSILKAIFGALLLLPVVVSDAAAVPYEKNPDYRLFGHQQVINLDMSAFKKWEKVVNRQSQMRDNQKPAKWKNFLATLRTRRDTEQIEAINSYINSIPYIEDRDNYKTGDYWASVDEFFSRGGDCEDYAIAKYMSLLALGFSADRMRIVILEKTDTGEKHAVLAVQYNGTEKILDNQILAIRNAEDIKNYQPIYAISKNHWWRFM